MTGRPHGPEVKGPASVPLVFSQGLRQGLQCQGERAKGQRPEGTDGRDSTDPGGTRVGVAAEAQGYPWSRSQGCIQVCGCPDLPSPLTRRQPRPHSPSPSSGHRKCRLSQTGASRTHATLPQPTRKGRVSTAVSCGLHLARQGAQTVWSLPLAPRGLKSGPAGILAAPGQAPGTGVVQKSLVFQTP